MTVLITIASSVHILWLGIWSMVEPALAIIACSLGTLRPLFNRSRAGFRSNRDADSMSLTGDTVAFGTRLDVESPASPYSPTELSSMKEFGNQRSAHSSAQAENLYFNGIGTAK